MLTLLALLVAPPAPQPIFACSFGEKRVEVVRDGATYTYRFGGPGEPELVIVGDKASGNLFYHVENYANAQDVHLRFVRDGYSYVLYYAWSQARLNNRGAVPHSETNESGLLVMREGKTIAKMKCRAEGDAFADPVTYNGSLDDLPDDGDFAYVL